MDMFRLLKEDHRSVEAVLDRLLHEPKKQRGNVQKALETLQELLTNHMQLEEQYLYPRLAMSPDTGDIVRTFYREHLEILNQLEEISHHSDSGYAILEHENTVHWKSQCESLLTVVRHHIREEEERLFPIALQVLSPEDVSEIVNNMSRMRAHQMVAESL